MYRKVEMLSASISLNDAWEEFITSKRAEGLKNNTLGNYQLVYDKFLWHHDFTGSEEVVIIDNNLINRWTLFLKDNMKPESVNSYLTIFRVFVNYCIRNGYLCNMKVKLMKHPETEREIYSDEEVARLSLKPNKLDFINHRTYCIVCFILATGARADTICNLKKEDLDFNNEFIKYTHLKNQKVAVVPMSPTLKRELKEFLRKWKIESEYVFPNVNGDKLTTSGLRQAHNKFCNKRGVRPLGPHALRHYFAKCWIKNNGNSLKLQKMLTHSSLTMTRHYVHLYGEELKEGFEQYCPLEVLRWRLFLIGIWETLNGGALPKKTSLSWL